RRALLVAPSVAAHAERQREARPQRDHVLDERALERLSPAVRRRDHGRPGERALVALARRAARLDAGEHDLVRAERAREAHERAQLARRHHLVALQALAGAIGGDGAERLQVALARPPAARDGAATEETEV